MTRAYFWRIDPYTWGGVTEEEHAAACARVSVYLSRECPRGFVVVAYPVKAGESHGVSSADGSLVPEEIRALCDDAWMYACATWDPNADRDKVARVIATNRRIASGQVGAPVPKR